MRPISKLILVLLMTIGGTTTAQAEPTSDTTVIDPSILAAIADLHLDVAFEHAMANVGEGSFLPSAGPSSMICKSSSVSNETETCVVTAEALVASSPAALAHR